MMNCQEHCKDEINKILENNRKMKDIEMKGKDRLYTQEDLKEYIELSENGKNLEYNRRLCMDGCEQRNRGAGGGHQGSQRTSYPKVQNKTKRRQPQQKRQQKRQQRRTIRRTDSRMRRRYRNETFVAM